MFNLCRRASFESLYLGVEVLALISLVGMGGGGMAKHSWCLPGKQWWERKCKDPGFIALCDRCEETKWKVGVLVGGGGSTLAHVRLSGVLSSFLLPCLRKPACVEKGSILAYSFRGSSPSSIVLIWTWVGTWPLLMPGGINCFTPSQEKKEGTELLLSQGLPFRDLKTTHWVPPFF